MDHFLKSLSSLDQAIWSYICIPLIIALGILFSFRLRFIQIFQGKKIFQTFKEMVIESEPNEQGVHPLFAFFASIGGCIGIGNVVAVCTAIQIGGPGAIFWMWIAAFLGMTIKYSEVFLGHLYRQPNAHGGFNGGPMYFLQRVAKGPLIPITVAILLCVYGTEVYMFKVVTDSLVENWGLNIYLVIAGLLMLIFFAGKGGVARVGKITTFIIPLFLVAFVSMTSWILLHHLKELPEMFATIFRSAFNGHAAIGGFAGSGLLITMSQGIARGCYSGDIGVGYASIVQAESRCLEPTKQARMAIFGIFLDTFIVCTSSTLLIMVTGTWHKDISPSLMVQKALGIYFPAMDVYMPIFLFILGYSSLIAFFSAGLKCAQFVSPRRGEKVYFIYSAFAFLLFSFVDQKYALMIMSITGALLLIINLTGMYRLRSEIEV